MRVEERVPDPDAEGGGLAWCRGLRGAGRLLPRPFPWRNPGFRGPPPTHPHSGSKTHRARDGSPTKSLSKIYFNLRNLRAGLPPVALRWGRYERVHSSDGRPEGLYRRVRYVPETLRTAPGRAAALPVRPGKPSPAGHPTIRQMGRRTTLERTASMACELHTA